MPKIEEREDGPLIVKELGSLTTQGGEIETKPVMALCRCGQSANKPFCDGSHSDAGFTSHGGTPAGRDRLIAYTGTRATITFNPLLCSHAAECGRIAKHVFNAKAKPWVQPDNGTVEELEAVVAACPSGALKFQDGPDDTPLPPSIRIEKNGPYQVSGIPAPTDPPGEGANTQKYVLCRCGLSGNKPYCDGSHLDQKWRDG